MFKVIGAFVSDKILRATGNRIAAAWLQAVREVLEVDLSRPSPGELLVWSLPGENDQFLARTIPWALAHAQCAEGNQGS
jgi:hypothetical protein